MTANYETLFQVFFLATLTVPITVTKEITFKALFINFILIFKKGNSGSW